MLKTYCSWSRPPCLGIIGIDTLSVVLSWSVLRKVRYCPEQSLRIGKALSCGRFVSKDNIASLDVPCASYAMLCRHLMRLSTLFHEYELPAC